MSLKTEVEALMASDGDHEKKISLLKKAVVSVTRQKLEIEARCTSLQDDMRRAKEELASVKAENLALHRRVTALESELEQERTKGMNFGQNIFKGLSSLVTGGDDAAGAPAVAAVAAGRSGTVRGAFPATESVVGPLSRTGLRPEDVEHIVKENEKLLRQVYTLQTQHDEYVAKTQADRDRTKAVMERSRKEVDDLRSLLGAATHACDELNAECTRQRSLAAFCRQFFSLKVERRADNSLSYAVGPAPVAARSFRRDDASSTTDVHATLASGGMQEACTHLSTMLDAVSVLLLALRDTLPRAQRATIGDLRLFADRLATLQEAHTAEKASLTYQLKELGQLRSVATTTHTPTASTKGERGKEVEGTAVTAINIDVNEDAIVTALRAINHRQQGLVAGVLKWLQLLRSHAALLVDSCVGQLPPGEVYRVLGPLPEQGALAPQPTHGDERTHTLEEREAFVEEIAAMVSTLLSALEGSLEALQMLLEASVSTVVADRILFSDTAAGAAPLLMDALLCFWWDGSAAAAGLGAAAAALARVMESVAGASGNQLVRDALSYLRERVAALDHRAGKGPQERWLRGPNVAEAKGVAASRWAAEASGTEVSRLLSDAAPIMGTGTERVPGFTNSTQVELADALAAADRAAVFYWTQMNATVLELAEKEDQLLDARDEVERARADAKACKAEAAEAQRAFQEKIKLLSDQLVQHASQVPHLSGTSHGAAGRS